MMPNQISAFEYVSILVSIILGLGITQVLSSLADLLFNEKDVKFYFPHSVWIFFILFLHIQDWFITYQLKDLPVWYLPELLFILLYPVLLYVITKVIMPPPEMEAEKSMKAYYFRRYLTIFSLMSASVVLSILFNLYLLKLSLLEQWPLLIFLGLLTGMIFSKTKNERLHTGLAILLLLGVFVIILLEKDNWVIR